MTDELCCWTHNCDDVVNATTSTDLYQFALHESESKFDHYFVASLNSGTVWEGLERLLRIQD